MWVTIMLSLATQGHIALSLVLLHLTLHFWDKTPIYDLLHSECDAWGFVAEKRRKSQVERSQSVGK